MSSEAARLEGIIAIVGADKGEGELRKVGKAADKTQKDLEGVEKAAKGAGESAEKLGTKATKASTGVDKLGTEAKQTSSETEALGRKSKKTSDDVDGLGQKSERTTKSTKALGDSLVTAGGRMQHVGGMAVKGATIPLIGMAVAMGHVGTEFDAGMSKVVAKSGATGAEIAKLRAQALQLGAQTSFSAREAAEGMEALAAAGMKPNQVMGAMPGLLDAAAASGEGVAAVAGIVANSLAQFNLEAGQSTRIADVLAKGSNETQASIGSMGEALKYAGTQSSQLGFSLEQTVGMTSMMVKAGIDGSNAGTALRMGLMQAAKGANASHVALKKLSSVSPELAKIWKSSEPVPAKLREMSTEFAKLDGTQRTVAAGLIFGTEASSGMLEVLKNGPSAIDKWTASMQNSSGEAKRMGTVMRDNLKGDMEAFTGSVETAMINMFDQADGPMRGLFRNATGMVNAFGSMGPAGQQAALGVGAIGAVAPLALVATGSLVRNYGELKTVAQEAGVAGRFAALALNPWALGAIALGAAVIGVVAAVKHSNAEDEKWRSKGVELAAAITKRREAAVALEGAIVKTKSATAAVAAAEDKYGKKSPEYAAAVQAKADATRKQADAQKELNKAIEDSKDKAEGAGSGGAAAPKELTTGEESTTRATLIQTEEKLAAAREKSARSLVAAQAEEKVYADVQRQSNNQLTELGAKFERGEISAKDYARAVDDVNSNLRGSKSYLDEASAAADRDARKVEKLADQQKLLADVLGMTVPQALGKVSTANAKVLAQFGLTGISAAAAGKQIKNMADTPLNIKVAKALLDQMTKGQLVAQFGTSNINKILAKIGDFTPSNAGGTRFAADMARIRANAKPVTVTVTTRYVTTGDPRQGTALGKGGRDGDPATPFARGGEVHGPGTGTSDEVPAWLSNGEHVLTAAEVRAMGGHGQVERWREMAKSGDLPAFKAGGAVVGGKKETAAQKKARLAKEKKAAAAKDAAAVTSDITGAKFDANTSDAALATKRKNAAEALAATVTAQREALAGLPTARLSVRTTAAALKKAEAANSAIIGKNSAARRLAYKPTLDKARDAAKAAVKKLAKMEKDAAEAKDKRSSLAADIVGYDSSLADSSKAGSDKTEQEAYDAEDLRREAMGEESQAEQKHREAINKIREKAGLPPIPPQAAGGLDAQAPDLEAQLAQANQRASDAEANNALSTRQLATVTGAGDMGFAGGANAWQSGAGAQPQVVYNINSLSGYDPAIQKAMANSSNGGNGQGGNADILYSGRS